MLVGTLDSLRRALNTNRTRAMGMFQADHIDSSTISQRELARGLQALGVGVSREETQALFDTMDTEGKGTTSYRQVPIT